MMVFMRLYTVGYITLDSLFRDPTLLTTSCCRRDVKIYLRRSLIIVDDQYPLDGLLFTLSSGTIFNI